jgi:cyanate lyase
MMDRAEATEKILEAKQAKGLTYQAIADAVGRDIVWTTAALLGQATMSPDEAGKATETLGLGPVVALALQQFPMKGSLPPGGPPTDPLIYRFHEIVLVYGTTLKAIIHEKFGDGIMSAIDFTMNVEKVPDRKGDRVKVTLDGKFLPYKKW